MKASSESGLCAMLISRGVVVAGVLVRTEVLVGMRVLAETSIVNRKSLLLRLGGGLGYFVFHRTHELGVRGFCEFAHAPIQRPGHYEKGGDRDQQRYVQGLHQVQDSSGK